MTAPTLAGRAVSDDETFPLKRPGRFMHSSWSAAARKRFSATVDHLKEFGHSTDKERGGTMKPISKLRFVSFVLWVSACCMLLLAELRIGGTLLAMSGLFLITRAEWQQTPSMKMQAKVIGGAALLLVVLIVVNGSFREVLREKERTVFSPFVVVPLWIFLTYQGYRRWRLVLPGQGVSEAAQKQVS